MKASSFHSFASYAARTLQHLTSFGTGRLSSSRRYGQKASKDDLLGS
jgi:hypothetical protein